LHPCELPPDLVGAEQRRLSPQPERLPIIAEKIRTMWLTEPDFTAQELASIQSPTLILDGAVEEVVRAGHAATIAEAIPNAELVLLPGVGHFAISEKPAEWNKVVLDFLKDR
jgi:pimeloyl-ACP methyl ester carboxylesterase